MGAPKTGVSIELLYCISNSDEDDFEDVFFTLIEKLEWHKGFSISELRRHFKSDPAGVIRGFKQAIIQGYELPQKMDDSKSKAKSMKWSDLISQFCMVYGTDPMTVWRDYPFAFFLEFMRDLEKYRYQKRLEVGLGTAFGFGSIDREAKERWAKIAYDVDPDDNKLKEKPKDKTDNEIKDSIRKEYEMMKKNLF